MKRSRYRSAVALVPALAALCLGPVCAHAQDTSPTQTTGGPTPEQRRQAGAAYDQAVAARAGGNFATAASLFETADRISPSPAAVGNAIRSHRDAHSASHDARAATLALRLLRRYSGDPRVVEFANNVVRELEPSLSRVRVQCTGCDIEIDHALSGDAEFFVEPGHHAVVGYWGNRTRNQEFVATAGGTQDVTLVAPPAETHAHPSNNAVAHGSSAPPPNGAGSAAGNGGDQGGRGLPPAVFIAGLAGTVVAGGFLIGFGVDALSGVSTYQANPTAALLADGQSRELRTNIMIGVTAGLGVLTVGALIFTNWHGGHRVDAAPGVQTAYGTLPGLTVGGSF